MGVSRGVVGAIVIVVVAANSARDADMPSIVIYTIGMLSMLGFSAAYNTWPISRAKWVLRRFDHSAIYVMIAGTYTAFIGQMRSLSIWLLVAGGALYSAGVVFHGWQSLRFHNAIWHGFVLVAACCHYSAILCCVA